MLQAEEGSDTVTLLQKTVDLSDSPHRSTASPTEGSPSPLNPSYSASTTVVKKSSSATTEDFIQNKLQEIKKIIKKAKEDQRKRQDLGMMFVMGTGPRGAFI